MKKIFLICTAILLLSGCSQDSKNPKVSAMKNEILKIGFCPTMQEEAMNLKEKNKIIELVQFANAGEVLQNLKSKNIDGGVIGRKAKKSEITEEIIEKKLQESGHTLIVAQKKTILENDLQDLPIDTCLRKQIEESYPELNLHFKDCDYKNGQPWLISWDDFSDEFELLIPINERGEKIKKFRTAYFYTSLHSNNFHF